MLISTDLHVNYHYGIDVKYVEKTFSIYLKDNPPQDYDEPFQTLQKIKRVLIENFKTNCSKEELLAASRNLHTFCKLYTSRIVTFFKEDTSTTIKKHIESLIYPLIGFQKLNNDIANIILSKFYFKELAFLACLNKRWSGYVNQEIIRRAKIYNYTAEDVEEKGREYLQELIKNINGFCQKECLKHHIGLHPEKTIDNIQQLITDKLLINSNQKSLSMLHLAIGKYKPIARLFMNKETINERNNEGKTPLMLAVNSDYDITNCLLASGAETNLKDKQGNTALHFTCAKSGFLVKINKRSCRDMQIPIINRLLACKSDINAQNNDGDTPLHKAILGSEEKVINLLIDQGADLNICNNKKKRAFSVFLEYHESKRCKW